MINGVTETLSGKSNQKEIKLDLKTEESDETALVTTTEVEIKELFNYIYSINSPDYCK